MGRARTLLLIGALALPLGAQVTLPDIDVSGTPGGIVPLPDDVPELFREHFVRYTRILAPNGKPIHILAADAWTDDQIRHGRDVLEFLLTDHPGSAYGADKSDIANAMADRKATMVFFNTEEDLDAAGWELWRGADLSMQDLRANECPAPGDADYMAHATRDAAYEEIWHLIHDYGVVPTRPRMIAEMQRANDVAEESGWRGWPDDEPENHANEYVGVLIDNYYDLWTVHPTLYEAQPIEPGDIPEGQSHFGRYFAGSRAAMRAQDPRGFALVEKFLPPHLTYTPILPEDFEGTFSMTFDPEVAYTYKTRHLRSATLAGSKDAALIGNEHDNALTGNAGDNTLTGGGGDDTLDGGEGEDVAVFAGPRSEYEVASDGGTTTVRDRVEGRDGVDVLRGIELLRFGDEEDDRAPRENAVSAYDDYDELVALFEELRAFQEAVPERGVRAYTPAAVEEEYEGLRRYRKRLAAFDTSTWPVWQQVDFHLVRAEMNALLFHHRVLRPWARDPGFYSALAGDAGASMESGDFLWRLFDLEGRLSAEDEARIGAPLRAMPEVYEEARANLTEASADLADLAIYNGRDEVELYDRMAARLEARHPRLAADARTAGRALAEFLAWLEENRDRMTGPACVGKDGYTWWMRNVQLSPWGWEESDAIIHREYDRVITFLKLEEHRNRKLPALEVARTEYDYQASVHESLHYVVDFLRDEGLMTIPDWVDPADYTGFATLEELEEELGPEGREASEDLLPESSSIDTKARQREMLPGEAHEYIGHMLDDQRAERQTRSPIRAAGRRFNMGSMRMEGWAVALEELLMQAGVLDDRPRRGREIEYLMNASHMSLAIPDMKMAANEIGLAEARELCAAIMPRGWSRPEERMVWFEMQSNIRNPGGFHSNVVTGKAYFMKLFRERAQALGEDFVIRDFVDEFLDSGIIPMSLVRWEMTGDSGDVTLETEPLPGGAGRAGSTGAHACPIPADFDSVTDVESYGFDGDFHRSFLDHPAWRSEEATIEQVDGVARLSATGTGISEAWKLWRERLPYDRSWRLSVTVRVPTEWESTRTDGRDHPQVGAGPWIGILDGEGKGRRVYEVNLAAIAGHFRFVQGQLIQNRLGEDPISVGHIRDTPESVRLDLIYCAIDPSVHLYSDGDHVDSQAIDERGIDNWGMSASDSFHVGIMGFAEWTDLAQNAVALDDFEVAIR